MKKITILLFLLLTVFSFSQDLVLIKFADKPSASDYLSNPLLMLSQKALDRRAKYDIDISLQDVPVETSYVSQIQSLGVNMIAASKWFNGVFAWATSSQISQAEALSFVSEVELFAQNFSPLNSGVQTDKFAIENQPQNAPEGTNAYNYGATETQVTQLNLNYLHDLGFTGEGITIAVMDNGFPGVNSAGGFSYIRNNGQIKGTYNFIDDTEDVYSRGGHGTVVLSTMGGFIQNQYVGTAIDADYYLFITENDDHELPDEEVHWVEAAEVADSIGADVFNTSLGYSDFDDYRYDYSYSDMNGATTIISRGAQIAAEKGIMVVNSAGNSGNDSWHYITAPADAVDVLTIGAVDWNGNPVGFSSYGPTADGRVKPDVDALGSGAAVIRSNGSIDYSSGTSFSSPIMAGAMACFIQAFPNEQPSTLRQTVRESASLYPNPTNHMGYGIPDFGDAYNNLLAVADVNADQQIKIYPNPTTAVLNIESSKEILKMELYTMEGKKVNSYVGVSQINMSGVSKGVYLLKVQFTNGKTTVQKIIRK